LRFRLQAMFVLAANGKQSAKRPVIRQYRLAPAERARQQIGRQFRSFLCHLETSNLPFI